MTQTELIILNFEEVRRRSIKLWSGLPEEYYLWKPDINAMHCLEMIRHVLGADYWFHYIIIHRGNIENFKAQEEDRPYRNLRDELDSFTPCRINFLEDVRKFSPDDLDTIEIIRSDSGNRRKLGDYLLRVAYHEGVHAGQFLSYLCTLGVERLSVWD